VQILYNDYKNQQINQAAPKAIKDVEPLVAIQLIVQHVLPPYFQKVRYFGILSTTKFKKIQIDIPQLIKENNLTVRTIFQIINGLLLLNDENDAIPCSQCNSTEFSISQLLPDKDWYDKNIRKNYLEIKNKSPDDFVAPKPNFSNITQYVNSTTMPSFKAKNIEIHHQA
jgi:hypothetical protein